MRPNVYIILFQKEFRLICRSRLQLIAIGLFLLAGCYSIYYGRAETGKQWTRIQTVGDSIGRAQAIYVKGLSADTTTPAGRTAYYNAITPSLVRFNYNFFVAHPPLDLATLSLGQRDLYPYYYILNAQSLYVQTLKGDINNPFKLSAGNFDLAFVFVYLLPLLLIALSFDVLSIEQDQGTYELLRMTGISVRKALAAKLLFHYLIAAALVLLLSGVGFAVAPAPPGRLMPWLAVLLLYAALWLSLIGAINSFRRPSPVNAIAAIGTWVVLLIVLPASLNLLVEDSHPVQATALAGLMRSRNMSETDEVMHAALDPFYEKHPWLRPADTTRSPYFYFQGYSAFLWLSDESARALMTRYREAVAKRATTMRWFDVIDPGVNTQHLLNQLAGSDLATQQSFFDSVRSFHHRKIFWFSNELLFHSRLMNADAYAQRPVFRSVVPVPEYRGIAIGAAWLLLLSVVLLGLTGINLRETRMHD